MHCQSIPHRADKPKALGEQRPTLARFRNYLASHGRPWNKDDDHYWQCLGERFAATEEGLLHGWIVQALNEERLPLTVGALWLMQYPAGQMVVASRWPQAPHAPLGLLYPDWSRAQHTKAALGVPWYNGEV